jgi:xanthine dehydrogenase YagR molybdenum-binding subunit
LRISNLASKKSSNVRIASQNIPTFDGFASPLAKSIPHGVAKDGVHALFKGAAMPMGGARLKDRIQFAFGAQFVEVRIHARTREIRVPRMVGA